MGITLNLDHETVSRIVFVDLQESRNLLMEDLERESPGVFDMNPAYDKAQIIKHIEALDLILEWYREPE